MREPHPDISCWWTLYDYGLDTVKTWAKDYKHEYPGERRAHVPQVAHRFKVLGTLQALTHNFG